MTQYHVDHSCGHTVTHQLIGKHVERDRKIAWLKTVKCRECFKADAEEAQNARVESIGLFLPALIGSEKQVAWAAKLRTDRLASLSNLQLADSHRQLFFDLIAAKAEARWWIDQRDASDMAMARTIIAEYEASKEKSPAL